MVLARLARVLNSSAGSSRRDTKNLQRRGRRRMEFESLESRALLSASGFATPNHQRVVGDGGPTPAASAGPIGYTPAQIRHAYGFDKIAFNNGTVPGDGTGTTIAIIDAYDHPNIASDLHQFSVAFGLPDAPTFTKVNQSGGTSYPATNSLWATEIAIDVEWAHAIAPKANILLVEASSNSWSNLNAAVDYARHVPGVVAISMSYGDVEWSGETSYNSLYTTPSGHGGVTFLASTGDSGAPAQYPAIAPTVVGVGGTALFSSTVDYGNESGWPGSGGGISPYVSQPGYQNGMVTQSTTKRTNPDVAYDSFPGTGFPVYDTFNNPVTAPWGQWGGTSIAAPQWAGLIAIANQGRALAGKAALDGATQTLPLLYSMPSTSYHDITSGTSTGNPYYSAGPGYDLVTGRGSPYADRVVNGLGATVTATASHFSVAAPSSSTAGTPFSVTVTALDDSNNAFSGYRGAVHFSSADSAAGLPANYTFTSSDNGVHTFAGVTLKAAGDQCLTVTDTVTSALVGTDTVSVAPAAADHLAYGQQPTNVNAGTTISPAVTVRVVDAYNNVITSDNGSQVTLAIGTNPAGGVLSGTKTAIVSGGVASFSNLAIDQVGAGYTLVAQTGALNPITSASFSVAVSTNLDNFDSGNLSAYRTVGATTPTASVSATAKHDGTSGLVDATGGDWIYRNDAAAQVKPGDTLSVWLQFAAPTTGPTFDGKAYFGFGASATGNLALVASPASSQLYLLNDSNYSYTTIGSASQTWQSNHWYRLQVEWGTSGSLVGKVFDSNGTTLLQTVAASCTAITSGGIAFRANGTYAKYWDTVQVTSAAAPTSGVTHFTVAAPSATPAGAAFSITVTALDAANNVSPSYRGTVHFTSSDGAAVLPADYTFTAADNGVHVFTGVALLTAATQNIAVTDKITSSILGSDTVSVSPAATATGDDFESGNLSAYRTVGATTTTASVSTTAKHDGTYGLVDATGSDWIYRADAASQVKQGDTVSVWLKFATPTTGPTFDGKAYFGFGASATGNLALVASPASNQLYLLNNSGYSYTVIGSAPRTWQSNHWYRLQVDWGTNGSLVGKVFDSDGSTLLQSVTAATTAITSGGIAFRANGTYAKYWDTVQVTPGVNQFAANAGPGSASQGRAANAGGAQSSQAWEDVSSLTCADIPWAVTAPQSGAAAKAVADDIWASQAALGTGVSEELLGVLTRTGLASAA